MTSSTARRLILILATLGLLLAACAGTGAEPTPVPAGTTAPTSAADQDQARSAPDFEIVLYQGEDALGAERVMLSELLERGQPVIVNFWAGLCPPCRVEMPDFQEVYTERKGEVLLVGVDIGPFTGLGSREQGRQLLQDLGVTYPAGTTFNENIVEQYRVLGMPSTYFVTPEGRIWDSWAGLLTKDKMNELIDQLIQDTR